MKITIDGNEVGIGDSVGFKSDIEQGGKIIAIKKARYGSGYDLTLENKFGFEGDYIGGDTVTVVNSRDCWTS